MPRNEAQTVTIEDAELIFRNFSGKEGQYNRAGNREFSVLLDEATAKEMLADGWNVKVLKGREDDEDPVERPYISVNVNFKNRPPRVVMISSAGRTHLTDDTVEILDWTDIRLCDLIIRAYEWEVGDKTGIKAYLQSMFVTIEEDDLERKYAVQGDA